MNRDAIELFEELGYTEYSDGEHCDFYINPEKGLTIEIRKYIDEFVKYNTNTKKRRGIDTKELQAINRAFEELGVIKQPTPLTEDVDWYLKNIRNATPNTYNIVHNSINNLESHITQLQQRNKELEKYCKNRVLTNEQVDNAKNTLKRMYEGLLGNEDPDSVDHYCMYTESSIPIKKDYKTVLDILDTNPALEVPNHLELVGKVYFNQLQFKLQAYEEVLEKVGTPTYSYDDSEANYKEISRLDDILAELKQLNKEE